MQNYKKKLTKVFLIRQKAQQTEKNVFFMFHKWYKA